MATKEKIIEYAKSSLKHNPNIPMFIYRVGGAWMTTRGTLSDLKLLYKVKIHDYTEIKLSDIT